MFIPSHIRLASRVIRGSEVDVGYIGKGLFCIGSIIPDFVLIRPQHQVQLTACKIDKRLSNIEYVYHNRLLRLFLLGIVYHYICDYFCRPHNDATILHGMKHHRYEFRLMRLIKYFQDLNLDTDSIKLSEYYNYLILKHAEYIDGLVNVECFTMDDVNYALNMGVVLLLASQDIVSKRG